MCLDLFKVKARTSARLRGPIRRHQSFDLNRSSETEYASFNRPSARRRPDELRNMLAVFVTHVAMP